jgi:hypothetical protein
MGQLVFKNLLCFGKSGAEFQSFVPNYKLQDKNVVKEGTKN